MFRHFFSQEEIQDEFKQECKDNDLELSDDEKAVIQLLIEKGAPVAYNSYEGCLEDLLSVGRALLTAVFQRGENELRYGDSNTPEFCNIVGDTVPAPNAEVIKVLNTLNENPFYGHIITTSDQIPDFRDLDYCVIFDISNTRTFVQENGEIIQYVEYDSESG